MMTDRCSGGAIEGQRACLCHVMQQLDPHTHTHTHRHTHKTEHSIAWRTCKKYSLSLSLFPIHSFMSFYLWQAGRGIGKRSPINQ